MQAEISCMTWALFLFFLNFFQCGTMQAEDILHDLGAISIMSSDSQAMGRIGEVFSLVSFSLVVSASCRLTRRPWDALARWCSQFSFV